MGESKPHIPSIASLSAYLAWVLLTPEQQQKLLTYLEEVQKQQQSGEETHEEGESQ